jgi:hypothetical protein
MFMTKVSVVKSDCLLMAMVVGVFGRRQVAAARKAAMQDHAALA